MPTKFPHPLDPLTHPSQPNKTLTFSFGNGNVSEYASNAQIAKDTAASIQEALEGMETAIQLLNSNKPTSDVMKWVGQFFLQPDPGICKQISAKFVLIRTGLSGNQRIKIGAISFKDQSNYAAGAVKKKPEPLKPKHGMRDYYTKPGNTVYGAMYFDPDSISGTGAGSRLVVHEASHKYADTSDYFYFDGQGMNTSKPERVDMPIFKGGDPYEKALSNADSYAWLFQKLKVYGSF
jgi:hypothetical protein